MYSLYLVVLFYCHSIWFYLTCLNEINGDGDGDNGSDQTPTPLSTVLNEIAQQSGVVKVY